MAGKTKTYTREFSSANILSIEVGTNTPCGGDAGHGGVTILKLRDETNTCWNLKCDDHETDQPKEITIELRGDTEAETFIKALEFAVSVLKAQRSLSDLGLESTKVTKRPRS